jgi:hypothetical protein
MYRRWTGSTQADVLMTPPPLCSCASLRQTLHLAFRLFPASRPEGVYRKVGAESTSHPLGKRAPPQPVSCRRLSTSTGQRAIALAHAILTIYAPACIITAARRRCKLENARLLFDYLCEATLQKVQTAFHLQTIEHRIAVSVVLAVARSAVL